MHWDFFRTTYIYMYMDVSRLAGSLGRSIVIFISTFVGMNTFTNLLGRQGLLNR